MDNDVSRPGVRSHRLETTIDLLVQKNKELYDEIMELRKENDALKDEGIRRDNKINELERQIENLRK